MALVSRLIGGLRGLFKKRQIEKELDEELRQYLEAAVEAKVSAGMHRDDAVRAARVAMGSLEATKDRVRDVGWESLVDSVWWDLRDAIRGLRRSPGFAAVAIDLPRSGKSGLPFRCQATGSRTRSKSYISSRLACGSNACRPRAGIPCDRLAAAQATLTQPRTKSPRVVTAKTRGAEACVILV
jgi:hypothetical protein